MDTLFCLSKIQRQVRVTGEINNVMLAGKMQENTSVFMTSLICRWEIKKIRLKIHVIRNMLFLWKPTHHVIMSQLTLMVIYYPAVFTVVVQSPVSFALCSVTALFLEKALDFITLKNWVQILAPVLINCVVSGRSLTLVNAFLTYKIEVIMPM